MERRLAITYIVAATTTFGVACFTIAIAGGGLFASAASPRPAGVKQVEIIDDYIVIHSSSTTIAPTDPAAVVPVEIAAAPTPALHPAPAARSQVTPTPAVPAPSAVPELAPSVEPHPATEESPATLTPAPVAEPLVTNAPAASPAPSPAPSAPVTPSAPPAAAPAAVPPPTTPPTTAPAARPPIPEGCIDPRFRNGTWRCDDD